MYIYKTLQKKKKVLAIGLHLNPRYKHISIYIFKLYFFHLTHAIHCSSVVRGTELRKKKSL